MTLETGRCRRTRPGRSRRRCAAPHNNEMQLTGTGKRFFAEGTPPRSFELVSTNAFPSGIIFSTYKVAGPLKTG